MQEAQPDIDTLRDKLISARYAFAQERLANNGVVTQETMDRAFSAASAFLKAQKEQLGGAAVEVRPDGTDSKTGLSVEDQLAAMRARASELESEIGSSEDGEPIGLVSIVDGLEAVFRSSHAEREEVEAESERLDALAYELKVEAGKLAKQTEGGDLEAARLGAGVLAHRILDALQHNM